MGDKPEIAPIHHIGLSLLERQLDFHADLGMTSLTFMKSTDWAKS